MGAGDARAKQQKGAPGARQSAAPTRALKANSSRPRRLPHPPDGRAYKGERGEGQGGSSASGTCGRGRGCCFLSLDPAPAKARSSEVRFFGRGGAETRRGCGSGDHSRRLRLDRKARRGRADSGKKRVGTACRSGAGLSAPLRFCAHDRGCGGCRGASGAPPHQRRKSASAAWNASGWSSIRKWADSPTSAIRRFGTAANSRRKKASAGSLRGDVWFQA